MALLIAILLGAVQGLTEFIPVSSSGHLAILQIFLNGSTDHLFIQVINFGTLAALLVYFHSNLISLLKGVLGNSREDRLLALNLLITAIPAGLIGFFSAHFVASSTIMNNLITVAIALALIGLIMIFIEALAPKPSLKINNIKPWQALIIGLAQCFALQPGVSRSGATILTGRFLGLDNEKSAQYSFLASIPIMLGVCAYTLTHADTRHYIADNRLPVLVGNLVAFTIGLIVIKYLLRRLKHPNSLRIFGIYRLGLATLCLILFFFWA
ncbi:undecaprenyl-diphosphate phosphatase [Candidatus Saccharibacteria bacterium]|nr:undecaprenyl-diphosphate phosphatase [Candidatus Saccharibacteria bacterium]